MAAPIWNYTINLAPVWNRNEARPFAEWRDAVVARIEVSSFFRKEGERMDVSETVYELSTTENIDDWNEFWECFYDLADYHRVWIKTI